MIWAYEKPVQTWTARHLVSGRHLQKRSRMIFHDPRRTLHHQLPRWWTGLKWHQPKSCFGGNGTGGTTKLHRKACTSIHPWLKCAALRHTWVRLMGPQRHDQWIRRLPHGSATAWPMNQKITRLTAFCQLKTWQSDSSPKSMEHGQWKCWGPAFCG